MSDAEAVHVLYGASLQIPICIGSVSLPLGYVVQLESAAAAGPSRAVGVKLPQSPPTDGPASPTTASIATTTTSTRRYKRTRGGGGDDAIGDDKVAAAANRAGGSPLSLRYTHRRYCFIRDGGAMAHDAFCRWLQHHTGASSEARATAAAVAVEPTAMDTSDELVFGAVPAATAASLASRVRERPPSLFYAMVDKIEFVVPSSFPQPRRVLLRPPFVIEDLCWAEHLVEVHVHFLPELSVPPVVLLHQATLNQRHANAPIPALKSATFEQPRVPPATVDAFVPSPYPAERSGADTDTDAARRHEALWNLVQAAAVSERKDSIRVLNPTTSVAAYARLVTDKMHDEDVIAPLAAFFRREYYGDVRPCEGEEATHAPNQTESTTTAVPAFSSRRAQDVVPVRMDAVPAYYTDLLLPVRRHHDDGPLHVAAGQLAGCDAHKGTSHGAKGHTGVSGDAMDNPQSAVATNDDENGDDDGVAVFDWARSPTLLSPLRLYHHVWDLPFEAAIFAYVTQRRRREAEGTIRAVEEQLREEQEALVRQLRELIMQRLPGSVRALHQQLETAYQRCLDLASPSASEAAVVSHHVKTEEVES